MSAKKEVPKVEEKPPLPRQSMADFLMNSPLRGSGLKIPKLKWKMRKIDL